MDVEFGDMITQNFKQLAGILRRGFAVSFEI